MDLKIFKLRFTTPLHLSNEREDYAQSLQTLHSDTLYAALTAALAKIGHDFSEKFNGDLGCTVSSLFPYYQKEEKSKPVYFFPKSRKIDILPEEMLDIHKDVKKIQWLDADFFQKYIAGNLPYSEYTADCMKGKYLSNKDFPKDFISAQVFPHAKVPRQQIIDGKAQDTEIYYMERLFFKDRSGMFFIAEGNTDLLKKGLNVLQYEGIGTDRNVGNGYFEFEEGKITLDVPAKSDYAMNLSLFLPENSEQVKLLLGVNMDKPNESDNNVAYAFKKRGGWVTTHPHNTIRKNRVYMFEEGSVFKTNSATKGRIADLKPDLPEAIAIDHKIYRNGKSLFLPVNFKN